MTSTPEFRKEFVRRLNQACDESPLVPERHKGRQNFIAERLAVAPEAVSKWFKAVSMPRPDKMRALAKLLDVDHAWLALGAEPEMDRKSRKVHAKRSSGAVHLVWGMISLSGGHCGEPSENDPRGEYVDFYATLHGVVYPIHVSLARLVSNCSYEVILPKEYRDVRVVSVIPVSADSYHFLDMSADLIDEHKTRKGGDYAVVVERADRGRYVTGDSTWVRIRNFKEFAGAA